MTDQKSDDSSRGQRIQEYCKTIWGDGYYDLDFQTEIDDHYASIRKDLLDSYGPLLLDSGRCSSIDKACDKLERMLAAECKARAARQGKRALA